MRGRGRLRETLLVVVALGAVGFGVLTYATDLFRRAELNTVDMRFKVRGDQPAPKDVVFVAINEDTFNDLQQQWPFRRRVYARFLDRIAPAKPRAVGLDIQFTEPSRYGVADDDAFIEGLRRSGNVVLAQLGFNSGTETNVLGGPEAVEYAKAEVGFSAFENEPGQFIRRVKTEVDGLAHFSLVLAERLAGKRLASREDPRVHWIDFAGGPGHIKRFTFSEVVTGKVPIEEFRDKIVIVGASAASLQDFYPTPTTGDSPMPGAEIHANAVATAANGFPLESGPGWLNVVLIVLLGAVAPIATLLIKRWKAAVLSIVAIVLAAVGAQLAFESGVIVSVVYALIAWVIGSVGAIIVSALISAFERERTRDLFARFVPESVVDEALQAADGLRLGGVRRVGTVMFSDLRGFTSFAETLPPDDVIAILNRYLTEMSDAILDEGGTLVAYMGDGIMAVFGAPLEQTDHADRALRAARGMLERMEGFNAWSRSEGLGDGFKMGIGLNSGPVMSGHVGSERRLEYTAIGDTTNTAARLEGMTKGTPHQLFVAQSTVDLLQSEDTGLEFAGEYEVRGRQAKIRLWAPPVEPARASSGAETAAPAAS